MTLNSPDDKKLDYKDETTFVNEFMAIRDLLLHVAFNVTKNHQDAEEIVSAVLLTILTKLRNGELTIQDGKFKSFACSSVKNLSLNTIRTKKTRHAKNAQFFRETHLNPSQVDEANYKELIDLFTEVLELIENNNHKRILEYIVVDGLKYEEIAEKENIEMGTVMSRLARARAKVRNLVAKNVRFSDLRNFDIL